MLVDKASILGLAGGDACKRCREVVSNERDRLKGLVLEVFECARKGADCEKCREVNRGYACVYVMRELGVEVDDA